jgi:DNA-binding CsgD family transcriptional regulator
MPMTTHLDERDVDRTLAAIGELTRPGSMRDLRFRSVAVIHELVPARHVAWGEIDPDDGHIKALMDPEPAEWPVLESAYAANLAEHPVIAHFLETGDGRAAAISDHLDAETFRTTRLYREFFEPIGSEDQLCVILPSPHLLVGIALDRSERGFSPREREILDRLSVPLANTYVAVKSYERLQRVLLATSAQTVEADGTGMLLIDRFARLEYASPNALGIIRRWFERRNDDGLPVVIEEWIKDGWNTHRDRSRSRPPISMERDGEGLVIEQSEGPDGLGACLHLRERPRPVSIRPLHVELGLSRREGQILALVASGMTNEGIGRALHISSKTVAKHVERILTKLGVPNRTAAAELLRAAERGRARGLMTAGSLPIGS